MAPVASFESVDCSSWRISIGSCKRCPLFRVFVSWYEHLVGNPRLYRLTDFEGSTVGKVFVDAETVTDNMPDTDYVLQKSCQLFCTDLQTLTDNANKDHVKRLVSLDSALCVLLWVFDPVCRHQGAPYGVSEISIYLTWHDSQPSEYDGTSALPYGREAIPGWSPC